ncbi:MAG: UDP-N-acetylmuramate dehydrogenase [Bacteroidales bacterium]|nr:UDP-N-acetylmuramate dehydrogenase [Candidatus Colimorpha onthohippi]
MPSLQHLHTFGLISEAEQIIDLASVHEIQSLCRSRQLPQCPFVILGGGSNILFPPHYSGTVLHPIIKGIHATPNAATVLVEAGSGENWADFVIFCARHGWHGLENLAAIPGCVGASPVQNVGAYGCEAKDFIYQVNAIEIATGNICHFTPDECQFGYRDSIFKHSLANRYIITSVVFQLATSFAPNLNYQALAAAVSQKGISNPNALQIIDIVSNVRWSKLPRPEVLGSAGSFFTNPIITASLCEKLLETYPLMPHYPSGDKFKISAGWLIEQCGWKGKHLGPCGVYEKQALVLVNHGGASIADVNRLANAIIADVEARFDITLSPEAIFVK